MVGFLFGGNTGRTYEDLQRQRETADAIAAQIMGRQLPTTALGGIGALIGGIGAGVGRYGADKELKAGQEKSATGFGAYLKDKLMGNSTEGSPYESRSRSASGMPMPGAASEVAATSPVAGDTYAPFMDTIKAGGVDNPYALAAIAATGRAESGWSGKKAVSTWSDPSESGQAGTSGGIMSWRGPRYQALAATGDLSPEGQAKFFLNEDPKLIESLKGAKNLEDAQQLMNNAWAFAGYNRPGGEAARRLGYAKGYVSNFQGGNGNTEVASLDPSAGMPSAAGAIERQAPASGYVDPMVSSPNAMPSAQPQSSNTAMLPQNGPMPQQRPQEVAQNGVGRFPSAPQPPSTSGATQAPRATNNGADLQQLMRWANDPFLSPDMKAQAQMMLQQELQKQQSLQQEQQWRARQEYQTQQQRADPSYQLEMETKQAQLEALRAKPQKQWQKLDDGTLFNPETAETKRVGGNPDGTAQFRFGGNSVEAQSLNGLMQSGALTADQAQQLGAGKTVTGQNGQVIFMTPMGVFGKSSDGTVSPMPGGQAPEQQQQSVDIFAGTPETNSATAPQPVLPPSVQPQAVPQTEQRPGMIPLTQGQGLDDKGRERRQMAIENGLDPNSEEGKRFILTGTLPASDRGVTAGDREAIRDADDQAQASRSAIEQLQSVIAPRGDNGPSLNDSAGSGALADWQAWAARNDPTGFFDDAKGQATTELSNTVLGQALGSLKSIFGAAPTEGERQILLDMQASVDKTPAERKIIIDKAIALANRKLQYQRDRAADLRGGDYYKSNRGQPNVQTNTPSTPAEAMGLPSIDGPAPNKRLRFNPATGDFE